MLVDEIKRELRGLADAEVLRKSVEYEKQYYDKPELYGVSAPEVRKVSSKYFQRIKKCSKEEIFGFCEELLRSGAGEERTIAFDWAFRLRRRFEESDFGIFEGWLRKHVHGWGGCDDLCTHAFGAFVFRFPRFVEDIKEWAKSENRWMKRACAVVLIYSVRRRQGLSRVFEIADLLLRDPDVMVQKGYGWMLKEASNKYPHEVYGYVMRNRREMPRTALRYAIEKLPSEMKRETMKRA